MNKIYRNGLFMLAAGALVASCADYNETDNFKADPDPSFSMPYKDLNPVKSYIDRAKYPNMTLGTTLTVTEFNKQELAHAAAVTNFDNYAFGTSLMSGKIISQKGVMNFLAMKDLLDHVQEIGGEVFGSPIVANANQCDTWFTTLTSPIEIEVETVKDKTVDYTTMEEFTGTSLKTSAKFMPTIVKNYDEDGNVLKLPIKAKAYIVEDFEVDPLGTYSVVFYAKVDKDDAILCTFSDSTVMEGKDQKKYALKTGKWTKVTVDAVPAKTATKGYLMVEGNYNSAVYIKNVTVSHTPDNHRPQTDKEVSDTITYALNTWCNGLMKYNEGRITSFDLIDEPLDAAKKLANGYIDLKHSTSNIFWQDIFGSENYAPRVSKVASEAFQKHGGDIDKLKFFIAEKDLDNASRFESLKYWISVWEAAGAKIDGINAKMSLAYSEDPAVQAENEKTLNTLLDNLASTGKLIRLSDFDIKYQDATGENVSAENITADQRQKLADYNATVLKAYMSNIPNEKQAGICKGNMVDTNDPVGLWSKNASQEWERSAIYKAWCDALSGK